MKTRLQRETTNVAAPESSTLFDELDLVRWVFLQLVGKRYPSNTVRTLKRKKNEADENYSLQKDPYMAA